VDDINYYKKCSYSSLSFSFLSDTPGPPGLPEIIDYDENMVELKWDAPFRDGGAPITG